MKTMKNFAAQQLTKAQMNDVKGGDGGFDNCGILYEARLNGHSTYVCSDQIEDINRLIRDGARLTEVE